MSESKPATAPPLIQGARVPLEAFCLALLFLGLCVLLSPDAFFKADAQHLVWRLLGSNAEYPHHPLFMPTMIAFGDLVSPLGLSPFEVARLFSQVGGAIAIGLAHVGFRLLGMRPWTSLLATLLFGLCPAVLFFANVVEFHGPFLAPVTLGLVLMSWLWRCQPGSRAEVKTGVLLGLSTSVAAGVHASGLLLPAMFLPWLLLLRHRNGQLVSAGRPVWKHLAAPAVAALVHGGGVLVFARVGRSATFLKEGFRHPQGIEHLPDIFVDEWLLPFLPLSLIPFLLLLGKRFRWEALYLCLALLPYLLGALRLLVHDSESGAYLLPLALPSAWACALALQELGHSRELGKHSLPMAGSVVLISALLALVRVKDFDRPELYRDYADDLEACIEAEDSMVLLGHPDITDELGAVLIHLPKLQFWVADDPHKYSAQQIRTEYFPSILPALQDMIAKGQPVYITDKALEFLVMPGVSPFDGGPAFVQLLEHHFDLEPVSKRDAVVHRLRPK